VNRAKIFLIFLISLAMPNIALALTCSELDGAYVVAADDTYLGFFGNSFASESINNQFGTYGSQFGVSSVRNNFSQYGSSFGIYSANNNFAFSPPNILKFGVVIGALTSNNFAFNGISLDSIDRSCNFFSVAAQTTPSQSSGGSSGVDLNQCLTISSPSGLIISRNSIFAEVSWQTSVTNTCNQRFSADVTYKAFDSNGFELERDFVFNVQVPAFGTTNITDVALISPPENADLVVRQTAAFTSDAVAATLANLCLSVGVPSGIVVDRNSTFSELSWQAAVTNSCGQFFSADIAYKVLNSDGFELDRDLVFNAIIEPFETKIITDTVLVSPPENVDEVTNQIVFITGEETTASSSQQCLSTNDANFKELSSNSLFSEISWQATITNSCNQTFLADATFKLFTAEGFEIDSDRAFDVSIAALATTQVTDTMLVSPVSNAALIATQALFLTAEATSVLLNSPPVVSIADGARVVADSDTRGGELVGFTATAFDADGLITTTEWLVGGSVVATGLSASIQLPNGTTTVSFRAEDNLGLSASTSVAISVQAPVLNASPVVSILNGDRTIVDTDGAPGEAVNFTALATDTDGTVVSSEWLVNGNVVGSGTNVTGLLGDGQSTITFKATDNDGATSITTATVTVTAPQASIEPSGENTVVEVKTSLGNFSIELFDSAAPATVANFLNYVEAGRYNGTFIHRSVPGFVLQGGFFVFNQLLNEVGGITLDPPVANEFNQSNSRGTLAMAKLGGDPDSATSQWFVNLADNGANLDAQNGGFTVFGQVIGDGMTVVDSIAGLPLFDIEGVGATPLINYLEGALLTENLVVIDMTVVQAVSRFQNSYAPETGVLSLRVALSDGLLVELQLNQITSSSDIVFQVVQDSVNFLTQGDASFAQLDLTTGVLTIPELTISGEVVDRSVRFKLTDAASLLFTLDSLE
jgi:peptidyl-prolyl cis-trans isomerase A (cyclophilin A)